jgi:cobalt/nickel transport protein
MQFKGNVMEKMKRRLLIGLLIAVLLTPVGILLPRWFNAGDAWGEWSPESVKERTGHIPEGMGKNADIWKAPIPDYSIGNDKESISKQSVQYILSGIVGLTIISLFSFGLSKMVKKE